MDLDSVKKHYQSLPDSKLISLATLEAKSLRPEVVPVLTEEIKRRNLSPAILDGMERQLKEPTEDELRHYANLLQKQPCPHCNSKTHNLNAIITSETVSIVLFVTRTKKVHIACPDCLDRFKNNANFKTIMLGWWAFIGPIRTIQSLMFNAQMGKYILNGMPTETLYSFVYHAIGALEAAKGNTTKLKNLMLQVND